MEHRFIMTTRSLILEAAAAVCVSGQSLFPGLRPRRCPMTAFKALKEPLQQVDPAAAGTPKQHEEDQKKHAEDQQKIQQLQEQLNEALKAPQVQPAGGPVSGEQFNSLKSAVDKLSQQYAESTSGPFALQDFMIVGDAEAQFAKIQGQHGGFALFDFAPIFLLRFSDKVLFEAGFDYNLQDNGGYAAGPRAATSYSFDLSFAQLDYVLNQYATLVAGDMLLPLGTYSERSAGWLNKFPDDPFARVRCCRLPGWAHSCAGLCRWTRRDRRSPMPLMSSTDRVPVDGTGNASSARPRRQRGDFVQRHVSQICTVRPAPAAASDGSSPGTRRRVVTTWNSEFQARTGVWNNGNSDSWSAAVVDAALHLGP